MECDRIPVTKSYLSNKIFKITNNLLNIFCLLPYIIIKLGKIFALIQS